MIDIGRELKTLLLLAVGSCIAFQSARAQAITWDSTYRPALYETMAEQFRTFATSRKDLVFLGNSISSYTNWSELLRNPDARNRGIPGDITFGVLQRLDDIIRGRPARVFILIGINDIGRNIPDSLILKNYELIIQRLKKGTPKTKIYFHTLLPVNNSFKPALAHFNKDEHIITVNEGLKKIAEKEGVTLIDLYTKFSDENHQLIKEYSFDGLHLNHKGYELWARILKEGKYIP